MGTEIDPICALQASMAGYQVLRLEETFDSAEIYVTATGNKDIIMAHHMAKMRHLSIVCNIGHFDNEIDVAGLVNYPGIKTEKIKDQVDKYIFPEGNAILLLAEGRLDNLGVFKLPKILDEEVARLHLAKLGVHLTELTDEQAKYICVPKEGPFKNESYLY